MEVSSQDRIFVLVELTENQHAQVKTRICLKKNFKFIYHFKGDSGGGATIQDGARRILVGIVSFGSESGCQRGYPAAFR